jgi:hypothetical protein
MAGRFSIATLRAVVVSLLSHVDVATKALADRLQRMKEAHSLGLTLFDAFRFSGMRPICGGAVGAASGRDAHLDVPLTNIAVAAFASGIDGYIGTQLFPAVPVDKQSNKYYIIDPDSWLRVPDTSRAPKTRPNRIEFKVSCDAYFAQNFALAGEIAQEDLTNTDMALQIRENTANIVLQSLIQDFEVRLANLVTSSTNVGSGVTVSSKWSDLTNSNPLVDVTTAIAFIRQTTGLMPNTLVVDEDTFQVLRRHSKLIELYKYTSGGLLNDEQIAAAMGVQKILHGRGVINNAKEGQAASMTNIWGNNALLCYVQPGVSLMTQTLGLAFRWKPDLIPAPLAMFRYNDPDPGKKIEVVEASYYQAEKVIAKNLGYLMVAPR